MGNLIKKDNESVTNIIKNMINPTETVKQITVKTTVKADEAIHTIW